MADVRLTENFSRSEFACKCGCGFDAIDPVLVSELQRLRDQVGVAIAVLSGCRCAKHNTAVGGAVHSQHVQGRAADIRIAGMTARQMYASAVAEGGFRGMGVADAQRFVHLDVRPTVDRVRWCYDAHGRETTWNEERSA